MIQKIVAATALEQLRAPVILIISIIAAPLFVLIYNLFYPGDSIALSALVYDSTGENREIVEYLETWSPMSGEAVMSIESTDNLAEAEKSLADGRTDMILVLTEHLTKDASYGKHLKFIGDHTRSAYSIAAVMIFSSLELYLQESLGLEPMFALEEEFISSGNLTQVDYYIPGLMVFALIILIFQVSMSLAGLAEKGLLIRLRLSKVSTFSLLSGISLWTVFLGVCSFFLTLLTARLFGSGLRGNWLTAGIIASLTAVSIAGLGMVIAAFSRMVSSAFIIANLPLMVLMFFSGAMFPIKKIELFTFGEISIGAFDFLPPSHAVGALHKLFVLGQPLSGILYEICALVLLTALYIAAGVYLYYQKQIKRI